jgi:hypothetical protein
MANFDDREKSFEHKYKHDKELEFKINARRNKLLGLWAATQLGLTGADAETYAKSVVMADFDKPGDDDVLDKVVADFVAKGIDVTAHRVRKHMTELMVEARSQVMSETKD